MPLPLGQVSVPLAGSRLLLTCVGVIPLPATAVVLAPRAPSFSMLVLRPRCSLAVPSTELATPSAQQKGRLHFPRNDSYLASAHNFPYRLTPLGRCDASRWRSLCSSCRSTPVTNPSACRPPQRAYRHRDAGTLSLPCSDSTEYYDTAIAHAWYLVGLLIFGALIE